ncbi:S24 family peptidase [Kordiimonas lacus]|uniref:Peptidase S24-like n=1 Tax=Kordiimonas lacus TaxID=637679 RepID=A0A1G6VHG8_9PROT|nr:S24 family peptidase [Kordiimonas lacus]SDD52941.1 Peptidase S24-like [Kordiimonas lacus]
MTTSDIPDPTATGYLSNITGETKAQFEEGQAPILGHDSLSRKWPRKHGRAGGSGRVQAFGPMRDLPVLGRAQGGKDGSIVMEDSAIDWTFRPADLQGVKNAFAVFVTGDSMVPKYKNQDLAYVHPTKPPRRGRFVLVETAEHTGFIKQFVKWDGQDLVLKQYNPAHEIRLPREQVLRVLLVIGSLDS